jgi:uncharacterized protein (DUF2384 family)
MKKEYNSFKELPNSIQKRISRIASDDVETWINTPIPTLDNRTIIDVMNQPDGNRYRVL